MKYKQQTGFFTIRLVVSLVLIALIAAVAVFKYWKMSDDIKFVILKTRLSSVRTAVLIYHSKKVTQGSSGYPSLKELQGHEENNGSTLMEKGDLPDNPFSTGPDPHHVVLTAHRPHPKGTQGAWAYDPETGRFYANTASGNEEEKL